MTLTPLTAAVRRAALPGPGERVLAALSGGPDSVALLDALLLLAPRHGFAVTAAHLDHGLRDGSADDASFCVELSARLGVALVCGRADVRSRARREGRGVEAAAREERYAFLRRVGKDVGATRIALAHTRDDQAETLLMRLLRGAGRSGLSAMRLRSGCLWRPLLGVPRAQVLEHLALRGLDHREDPTNRDPAHLRNRVRHELLPLIEARFNPSVRAALARLAGLLADETRLIDSAARRRLGRIVVEHGALRVEIERLNALPPALRRAALRHVLRRAGGLRGVSARHVEELLQLAAAPAPSGRRLALPGGREASFSFGVLRVAPARPAPRPFAYRLPVPGRVELPGGLALAAQPCDGALTSNGTTAVVALPAEGLEVRTRRPGDRILERGREISLRRYLMAARVPAEERAALPLVAAGRRVLWLPGLAAETPPAGAPLVRLELLAVAAPSESRVGDQREIA
jgi:tRNA(Ile)-lysidine synthase